MIKRIENKVVFRRSMKHEWRFIVFVFILAMIITPFLLNGSQAHPYKLETIGICVVIFIFVIITPCSFLFFYFKLERFEITRTGLRGKSLFHHFFIIETFIKWEEIRNITISSSLSSGKLIILGKGNKWTQKLNLLGAARIDIPLYIVRSKDFLKAIEAMAPEHNVLKKQLIHHR